MAVVPEMAVAKPTLSPATVPEPRNSASCLPTAGAVCGLASTAEAVYAKSGSEIAAAATRVASWDVRM